MEVEGCFPTLYVTTVALGGVRIIGVVVGSVVE
jgi:hypothetical protein